MKRVTVVVLSFVVMVATGCTAATEEPAAVETLSLYSSVGADGPVSQLGLPATDLKDAFLTSPHQTITFARWAAAPELTRDQLTAAGLEIQDRQGFPVADQQVRAPEGHELFLVDAGNPGGVPMSLNDGINKVTSALVVDGVSRPLGNSLFAYRIRHALLAVVPKGAEVRLELTDEGRTQSLDLRTGKRSDAAAAFYPMRQVAVSPSEVWRYRGSTYTTVSAHLAAKLSPWTEREGWAPEGQAWLTGRVSVNVSSVKFPDMSKAVRTPATIQVNLSRSLRLSGLPSPLFPEAATVLALDPRFDGAIPEEAGGQSFTVAVPEKLTRFTVAFEAKITSPGYVRDADLSDQPRAATLQAVPNVSEPRFK